MDYSPQLSENLDILYELGKYEKIVFIANKKIWNHKLDRINYLDAGMPNNASDIKRYMELLRKTPRIIMTTWQTCNITHILLAPAVVRVQKIKITNYMPPSKQLESLIQHTDMMKIKISYWIFKNDYNLYREFLKKYGSRLSLRLHDVWVSETIGCTPAELSLWKSMIEDIKITANDYYHFEMSKSWKKHSMDIINPEIYYFRRLSGEINIVTFAKKRTIILEDEGHINSTLIKSILTNTETVEIRRGAQWPHDYTKKILESLSSLKDSALKLLIFKSNRISDGPKIIGQYGHLSTNIVTLEL